MNEPIESIERTGDNRYQDNKYKKEKIDGIIYLMASPGREHVCVNDNMTMIFNDYFKRNRKRCRAFSNAQINIDENNYVVPDIQVLCRQNSKSDIPVTVIEILSKSTRKIDLGIKMKKYAELGIREYWIITWEAVSVDIYSLNEENKYELYNSYSLFVSEDRTDRFEEDERQEAVSEFSPLSFPELKVRLADVFDIFE